MYKSQNKIPANETKKERRRRERNEARVKKAQESKFDHERKFNIDFVGKTQNQKAYIAAMYSNDLVIAKGFAGTGKTYSSTAFACRGLVEKKFERVIISRPNIPVGRSLGFFPGTVEDKLTPWLAQILAYIREFVNQSVVELWMKRGNVQMVPLETMRGRSFENSCVILDEAQNMTMSEFICVTTRIGTGSKLFICGDEHQSDLNGPNDFGNFSNIIESSGIEKTAVINFTIEDCLRSSLTKELLLLYEDKRLM